MKVKKWVEMSEEVDVEIGADDIRCALAEAFARVNVRDVDDTPNRHDISSALNSIGVFLNALTNEHIALLSPAARATVACYLGTQSERFKVEGQSDAVATGSSYAATETAAKSPEPPA